MMQRRALYRLSPPLSPRAHVLCFSGKGNICINWAKDEPDEARKVSHALEQFETAGSLNSQAGKTKTLGRKEKKKATKNDSTKGLKVPLVYRLSVRFSMKTTRSQI